VKVEGRETVQLHSYRLAGDVNDVEALRRAVRDVSSAGTNAGKAIHFVGGKGSGPGGAYDCDPWLYGNW